MKKLTLTLLTLLMVMPSLVCSMSLCPMGSAQAAEIDSPPMPCHEQAKDNKFDNGAVMLMTDCMGVDLQKADTAQVNAPDLSSNIIIYPAFTNIITTQLTSLSSNAIRGPPPQIDIVAISSSIYQTTQRFRI